MEGHTEIELLFTPKISKFSMSWVKSKWEVMRKYHKLYINLKEKVYMYL